MPPPRPLLLCILAAIGVPAVACCDNRPKKPPPALKQRPTKIPQPPFLHARTVAASASAFAPAPGDAPFQECSAGYRSHPEGATGGPYVLTHCYAPPPGASCLPLDAPALPRVLGSGGYCVFREDKAHEDRDPGTGKPRCCYNLWGMGIGRPLYIGDDPRLAPLGLSRPWG